MKFSNKNNSQLNFVQRLSIHINLIQTTKYSTKILLLFFEPFFVVKIMLERQ